MFFHYNVFSAGNYIYRQKIKFSIKLILVHKWITFFLLYLQSVKQCIIVTYEHGAKRREGVEAAASSSSSAERTKNVHC